MRGRIFDDRGNRMSPSHARKRGIKYRYYLSSALLHGQSERAGSVRRVPAAEIEALVGKIGSATISSHRAPIDDRVIIHTHVARVEVNRTVDHPTCRRQKADGVRKRKRRQPFMSPGTRHRRTRRLEIFSCRLQPQHARPIRSETRATLVASIAPGRRWLDELITEQRRRPKPSRSESDAAYASQHDDPRLPSLHPIWSRRPSRAGCLSGMGVARLPTCPPNGPVSDRCSGLPAQ